MTSVGGNGKRFIPESDQGAGPATTGPPAPPEANKSEDDSAELERWSLSDDGALLEIIVEFRRRLLGLRFLPRQARAGARREIRLWRRVALKNLRDRRAAERSAVQRRRRQRLNRCGPS